MKKFMEEKNLTQVKIAEIMGITQPQVSNWFQGKRLPSAYNLIRLAKIFDIKPEELYLELKDIQILNTKVHQ
jgi:transcriptional regulator with XRE-family HTH domain